MERGMTWHSTLSPLAPPTRVEAPAPDHAEGWPANRPARVGAPRGLIILCVAVIATLWTVLDAAAARPYISASVIGRVPQKWSIQFTRRMSRQDGTFDGVIVVSVDPFYFSRFFDSINLGPGGIAWLAGLDGIVRAGRGPTADDIGQNPGGSSLFAHLRHAGAGSFVGAGATDGIERIYAYTTVPDYPLVAAIGVGTDDALAETRQERRRQFAVGATLTLIIAAFTVFLARGTRRRRDAEMRRQDDSFRMLFDSNPVPMWLADVETLRFVAVNDAAVRHYGYDRNRFLRMSVLDILPAEDREEVQNRFATHGLHAGPDRTWRHVKADGTAIDVSVYRCLLQHRGRETSLVGVIDVTERLRAEAERDRNRRFLDQVIESVPTTIYVKDARDLRYMLINRAGEKLWGVPRGEAIGKTAYEIFTEETADFVTANDLRLLESGTEVSLGEHTIHTPRNGSHLVTSRGMAIRDQDGKPRYLVGVIEDVTERKAIEAQLRQTQKMEAVGSLSDGIAHDFNNLLTIIIGNLDLLQAGIADNPAAAVRLGSIRHASERGVDLTHRMLTFSRRQPLQAKPIDLNEVIAGAMLKLDRTLGEAITVEVRLGRDVGVVVADPDELETALLNVAINARDAMPAGGTLMVATREVEIDADYARLHPEVKPGPYAAIEVTDTGDGMPPEIVERIFEPFFTTRQSGKGTGLGLSMVYGIMKQSGGHVSVYSEVGRGTTFRLMFPLLQAAPARAAAAEAAQQPPTAENAEMIGVVDDNADVRSTAVLQLKLLG
jgi:two-component system cell cycle sensor histidine kinase/response regulator CckA